MSGGIAERGIMFTLHAQVDAAAKSVIAQFAKEVAAAQSGGSASPGKPTVSQKTVSYDKSAKSDAEKAAKDVATVQETASKKAVESQAATAKKAVATQDYYAKVMVDGEEKKLYRIKYTQEQLARSADAELKRRDEEQKAIAADYAAWYEENGEKGAEKKAARLKAEGVTAKAIAKANAEALMNEEQRIESQRAATNARAKALGDAIEQRRAAQAAKAKASAVRLEEITAELERDAAAAKAAMKRRSEAQAEEADRKSAHAKAKADYDKHMDDIREAFDKGVDASRKLADQLVSLGVISQETNDTFNKGVDYVLTAIDAWKTFRTVMDTVKKAIDAAKAAQVALNAVQATSAATSAASAGGAGAGVLGKGAKIVGGLGSTAAGALGIGVGGGALAVGAAGTAAVGGVAYGGINAGLSINEAAKYGIGGGATAGGYVENTGASSLNPFKRFFEQETLYDSLQTRNPFGAMFRQTNTEINRQKTADRAKQMEREHLERQRNKGSQTSEDVDIGNLKSGIEMDLSQNLKLDMTLKLDDEKVAAMVVKQLGEQQEERLGALAKKIEEQSQSLAMMQRGYNARNYSSTA